MDDFCRVNLAVQTTEPNGMICDIHVGYEPIASSRIPRHVHVAYSGRVGDASSVIDDLCPVNLAQMACCTNYTTRSLKLIKLGSNLQH